MKYSDNITIQKFIEQLIDALKYENECKESYDEKFNIPFLVSSLWEDLTKNYRCYDEFCSDLRNCDDYDIVIHDSDYYICKVNVIIYNGSDGWGNLKPDFEYEITFGYVERNWGYCKCSPWDKDYRKDKHCCGHGCDWDAPWIMVRKSFFVSEHSWSGDEHDFWDFEDKFYANDKEENEKKLLAEREYKIKNLKETIENAQKELKKLENL
jgi:hypothetical protein|nr:MAG TPA: hypothetical protein [Caudoviricetes sp.]